MRSIPKVVAATAALLLLSCTDGDPAGPAFTVGGTVAGLSGSGLVLRNNGGNALTVGASATTFAFSTSLSSGAAYNVSVSAHPTGPSQACAVANATGTIVASITNVAVTCTTNSYAIGGTIVGLAGTGLELRLNGGSALTLAAGSASYAFATILSGTSYTVTVATQPSDPAQTCTIVNPIGTVGSAPRMTLAVTCTSIPPTLSISINPTKVRVGQSAIITWSSTNATSCAASNAWSGPKGVAGTATITPSAGGQPTYVLACTGAGGTLSQAATLVVPMPVFPSSYENAKSIVLSDPTFPNPQALGIANPTFFASSLAFADFFQEGKYSAIVTMLQFSSPQVAFADRPSRIFFSRRNASGSWIDATPSILADPTGCMITAKILVADFNGDAVPDVFFACHGYDAPPFPGEDQRILLSQPNGTYANVQLLFPGFSIGGAAADLNKDGRPDVVLTGGESAGGRRPYVLLNNGDGTFTQALDRLPTALLAKGPFALELIDVAGNGNHDLFFGGGLTAAPNGVISNDGTGRFLSSAMREFPNPPASNGTIMREAWDFALVEGSLYYSQGGPNHAFVIRKLRLADLVQSTLYEHHGEYLPWSEGPGWSSQWIYPRASDRKIVPQGAGAVYPISPNSTFGWSISY